LSFIFESILEHFWCCFRFENGFKNKQKIVLIFTPILGQFLEHFKSKLAPEMVPGRRVKSTRNAFGEPQSQKMSADSFI